MTKKRKKRRINIKRILVFCIPLILILIAVGVAAAGFIRFHRDNDSQNNQEYLSVQSTSEYNTDSQSAEGEDSSVLPDGTGPGGEDASGEEAGPDEKSEYDNSYLADDVVDEEIEELISQMTLHEKVCQMMVVTPDGLTGVGACTNAGEQTKAILETTPVGGICLMGNNVTDATQVKNMISNYQTYAKNNHGIGLFICTDEEGGAVARFAGKVGNTRFSPMFSYKDEGAQVAYDNAKTIGSEIFAFGVNLDLAPVADVWSNPENHVIGTRAYSDDPKQAAELVAAAVQGFHDGGIMCILKHFPGHGDTKEDSHVGSAYSYKTLDELKESEFLPFEAGINAGADMVMSAHVTVPSIDDRPASLSSTVLSILRDDLNFKGIIMTDSLSMQAVAGKYSYGEIGVKSVQAGNDILLVQLGLSEMISAVETATENGEISEDRIDESVRRILKMKKRYGLLE